MEWGGTTNGGIGGEDELVEGLEGAALRVVVDEGLLQLDARAALHHVGRDRHRAQRARLRALAAGVVQSEPARIAERTSRHHRVHQNLTNKTNSTSFEN